MNKPNPFTKRLRFGSKLGLERITRLCELLGDPQLKYKTIHIGGTNGKGSTAAILSSILEHNQYRVGLFTSPHLVDYRERFKINQELIPTNTLRDISEKVNRTMSKIEQLYPDYGSFTEFEAATAVAFLYFASEEVDWAIIEVGLGGRLDATNPVMPEVSVITPIGLDHTDRLGQTIQEIAFEKAGIIKEKVPIVSGLQLPEAASVLRLVAEKRKSPYLSLNNEDWQAGNYNLTGGCLSFPYFSNREFAINLVGKHQLENAALALLALKVLHKKGLILREPDIHSGLLNARWPGRLEVLSKKPLFILDGAHNKEGIIALTNSLARILTEREKLTFVIGLSADKDPDIIKPLIPFAKRMIFTEALSSRTGSLSSAKLCEEAASFGVQGESIPNIEEALRAVAHEDNVCICGSLYLIGDFKMRIGNENKG